MSHIDQFRGSKYTFCQTDKIYEVVTDKIAIGEHITFIGLPCHIAGLQNYIKVRGISDENLLTVDLICHGTPPPDYLSDHVNNITGKDAKINFRDNRFGTENFYFTISKKDKLLYKKSVKSDDTYQIGYHGGYIYRQCCYNCIFAQKSRTGDLTIGDYSHFDKPYGYQRLNMSCVLVNTKKGEKLLADMANNKEIYAIERPVYEIMKYEKQLSSPTKQSDYSILFNKLIKEYKDYDRVAYQAFKPIIKRNGIATFLRINDIKIIIKRLLNILGIRK